MKVINPSYNEAPDIAQAESTGADKGNLLSGLTVYPYLLY